MQKMGKMLFSYLGSEEKLMCKLQVTVMAVMN